MRTLLTIIMALFGMVCSVAQKNIDLQTMEIKSGTANYHPLVDIKYNDNEVVLEYSFPSLNLKELPDGSYSVAAPDFGMATAPGSPMMPKTIEYIPIPDGYNAVDVEVLSCDEVELPFKVGFNISNEPNISSSDMISCVGISHISGHNIAMISLSPFSYSLNSHVMFNKNMKIRLTVYSVDNSRPHRIALRNNFVEPKRSYYDPDKPDFDINNPGLTDNRPTYIIISDSSFKPAIKLMEEWKKTIGYNVITFYFDYFTYPYTNEDKLDAIDYLSALFTAVPDFDYAVLLIVGNQNVVPMRQFNPDDNSWESLEIKNVMTDADHYTLYPDYSYPDYASRVKYGRIPAGTVTEAMNAVKKIIAFEQNEHPIQLCNTTALISEFIDVNNDGREDNNWVGQLENLRSYMLKSSEHVTIPLYNAASDVTPKYWNNALSSIFTIPMLSKPSYPWSVSASNINSAIDRGSGLITYIGSGAMHQWNDYYKLKDWESNKNYYNNNILISMSNFSGFPLNISMGTRALLSHPTAGSVGVIAPTSTPYMDRIAYYAEGVYRAMYPDVFNIGLPNRPGGVRKLPVAYFGDLNTLAMASVNQMFPDDMDTKNMQIMLMNSNIGDPGMIMGYIPKAPCDVDVQKIQEGNEWKVLVTVIWPYGIGGTYFQHNANPIGDITIYDKSANSLTHTHGNVAIANVSDPSNTVVSVRYQHSRPVVIDEIPSSSTVVEEFYVNYERSGDDITLHYQIPDEAQSAYVHVVSLNGVSATLPCDVWSENMTVSLASYPAGVYKIVITTDAGKSNTLSIQK